MAPCEGVHLLFAGYCAVIHSTPVGMIQLSNWWYAEQIYLISVGPSFQN